MEIGITIEEVPTCAVIEADTLVFAVIEADIITCAVLEIDMVSTVESGAFVESSKVVGEYPLGGGDLYPYTIDVTFPNNVTYWISPSGEYYTSPIGVYYNS